MRHKYVTRYDPEQWEYFFEELKKNGFVAEEYEYLDCAKTKKFVAVGAILYVVDKGRKFMAISSNMGRVITTHKYYCGKHRKVKTRKRIMYRLTSEGAQHIKELIVVEKI